MHGKKIVVVLPVDNAERILEQTHAEIPREVVDEAVMVDDGSRDRTIVFARCRTRRMGCLLPPRDAPPHIIPRA